MEYVFLAVVILLASIMPELTGFGVATVSITFLSLFLPLELVIPLVAIISVAATGIIFFTAKSKGIIKHVLPLIFGAVVGVFLGMLLLKSVNEDFLKIFLGVFLIVYSLYNLLFSKIFLPTNKIVGGVTGLIAGFFASLFNIHGPLVGIYSSSSKTFSKEQVKASIATYMFFAGSFTVIGHGLSGRVTTDVLLHALFALPFLLLGLFVGRKIFNKININWVKRGIYIIIFFAGFSFLF